LISFRNHTHVKMGFGPQINVIWGSNGAGKTSVLEGIHLLSVGKSFKTARNRELLRTGDPHFSVTGCFSDEERETVVQCNQLADGQRRFLVNGKALNRTKDLVGRNPVVILSPEEQIITKGSPSDRRRYFNRVFSVISQEYLGSLSDYQQILKQRNSLLQESQRRGLDREELAAWDRSLVSSGMALWKQRHEFLKLFQQELLKTTTHYIDEVEITMNFTHIPVQDVAGYEQALKQSLDRDCILGRTSFGPHRDRIDFEFNQRSLREYGSQGEQKLALILIKIAEFSLIQHQTGKTPTFLLDDLFAKLDFQRSDRIMALLNSGIQTIITTTDLMDMENHGLDIHQDDMVTIKLD